MADLELTVMETPNRARHTTRSGSIDRFYVLRGAAAGAIDGDIIVAAEEQGFPQLGDTTDGVRGVASLPDQNGNPILLPCFDRGLVQLLGLDADGGTQGAILFARFGFQTGGGTVVGNQSSAISTTEENFPQPYFHADLAGFFRQDKPNTRSVTTLVYAGIVQSHTVEEIQGEIAQLSGHVVRLRFPQTTGPDFTIFHVFRGARMFDLPGQLLRYAAVFSTSGQVAGIPDGAFGNGVGCDDLNHLETYAITPVRSGGSAPSASARPVIVDGSNGGQYLQIANQKLTWIQGLPRG